MEKPIFSNFGIEIYKRQDKLYIRVDDGGIASHLVEIEITDAEANEAQRSERDAYNVLMRLQKSKRPALRVQK